MKKSIYIALFTSIVVMQLKAQHEYQILDGDHPNRYEGKRSINVSAPALEVLSFIGYREAIAGGTDTDLKVLFYMPEDTTLYISAKELVSKSFYLMKPIQNEWHKGWKEFTPWPTSTVINPLGIDVNTIGLIGRLYEDKPGNGALVPLILYDTQEPDSINSYCLHFKPKSTLSEIQLSIYKKESRESIDTIELFGNYFGGQVVSITFPFEGQAAGDYTIKLSCTERNSLYGPGRIFHFHHQPIVSHDQ